MADWAQRWHELVSGKATGLGPMLLRAGLWLVEVPYSLVMRLRNWRYDTGRAPVSHVGAPVICIGNLTLGGTGKTPMVEWLAIQLRRRNLRVAIVSRGYGAEAGARNDEALELEQRLPDVPHLQNVDRADAAHTALEEFAAEVLLLDDGFQHRRLARDFDLVLLDAADPFGADHVFPRGFLREPVAGLRRADAVVLSRADMIDATAREKLRARVARLAPEATWAEAVHAPKRWLASDGKTAPLEAMQGKRVGAFCGIGNPAGFRHSLTRCGCEIVALRTFSDHHNYSRTDVEQLAAWAKEQQVETLVCTHKDLVKLGVSELGGVPLWALVVGLEFLAGEAELMRGIEAILPVEHSEHSEPSS